MNVYEYCGNGPVGMSDASGLEADIGGPGVSCDFAILSDLFGDITANFNKKGAPPVPDIMASVCALITDCSTAALCSMWGSAMSAAGLGPAVGCLVGALCSVLAAQLSSLCGYLSCDEAVDVPGMICNMISGAIAGCVGGIISVLGLGDWIGGMAGAVGANFCAHLEYNGDLGAL